MTEVRKKHWESVYRTKSPDQVSWTQLTPHVSLELIESSGLDKTARIIDVGGGDSRLVDHLLDEGFENITVLDISEQALEKVKKRLGDRANLVKYISSDIVDFKPEGTYDLWHDRAAFHFLINNEDIETYRSIVNTHVTDSMIIGTFSKRGPLKCSGLEVSQYDPIELEEVFKPEFKREECLNRDHETPFRTQQNFIFCRFKK
ncbi:class I SAM-dependent methyltransferase [Cryomorphaceae bacterium 1068]|nr:class I SAM-dependent methyltransferase [Cryomorphaceae bacterium 1068]